jgi:hypothetical protein
VRTVTDVLAMILDAVSRDGSRETIVGTSMVATWPEGLLIALERASLLVRIDDATVVECPGCHESCIVECAATGSQDDSSFVICNQAQAFGLIELEATFRHQWATSRRQVARFVAQQLSLRIKSFDMDSGRMTFGLHRGLGVPLSLEFGETACLLIGDATCDLIDLLTLQGNSISVDRELIGRLSAQAVPGGKRHQHSIAKRTLRKARTDIAMRQSKALRTKSCTTLSLQRNQLSLQNCGRIIASRACLPVGWPVCLSCKRI